MKIFHSKDSDRVEVASDPTLYSAVHWLSWEELGKSMGLKFNPLKTNLVDEVWIDRPARPNKPLHVHKLEFAGKLDLSWFEIRKWKIS